MLFLGFSGSVQAIPFSMSHHLDRGISLFNLHGNHDNFGYHRWFEQSDGREGFDGRLANDAGQNHSLPATAVQQEFAVMCMLPQSATEPNATSSVPEGGATAMLVGAAMVGLVFMRKKQSA